MDLHPLLKDPRAVLVVREPVPAEPAWADFELMGRLRLDPPFEVISGVKEEQLGAVA